MKKYVVGLVFSSDPPDFILMVKKNRPDWQRGMYNGVGGKIEKGETPIAAMRRECLEESGLDIAEWNEIATYSGENFHVTFFSAFTEEVFNCKTMTDEPVGTDYVSHVLDKNIAPTLSVIIPLALDKSGIGKPVHFHKPVHFFEK